MAIDYLWCTDGSLVPVDVAGSYTTLLVGIDLDAAGGEACFVLAT
jgi:hypothetical protein